MRVILHGVADVCMQEDPREPLKSKFLEFQNENKLAGNLEKMFFENLGIPLGGSLILAVITVR